MEPELLDKAYGKYVAEGRYESELRQSFLSLLWDKYNGIPLAPSCSLDFVDNEEEEWLKLGEAKKRYILGYSWKNLAYYSKARNYLLATKSDISLPTTVCNGGNKYFHHKKIMPFLRRVEKALVAGLPSIEEMVMEQEHSISSSQIVDFIGDDGLIDHETLKNLPGNVASAIKSLEILHMPDDTIKYKLTLWDKGASLGRIQKMAGLYAPERHVVTGAIATIGAEANPKQAAAIYAEMMKGNS